MAHEHTYKTTITWTGNKGTGTSNYKAYDRNHSIFVEHKAPILGSSDPNFRGDKTRHNPEELLVASIASCHMLWYLHLCAANNVVVIDYTDKAIGTMQETDDGAGFFTQVLLQPAVTIMDAAMTQKALELHHEANKMCFIASSVKFPIYHQPIIKVSTVEKAIPE